jgi:hypothetical protein
LNAFLVTTVDASFFIALCCRIGEVRRHTTHAAPASALHGHKLRHSEAALRTHCSASFLVGDATHIFSSQSMLSACRMLRRDDAPATSPPISRRTRAG